MTGYPEATEFDALSKIYAEKPDLEAENDFCANRSVWIPWDSWLTSS